MKTKKRNKAETIFIAVLLGFSASLYSETLTTFDADFSVSNVPVTSNILSGRWGVWDSLSSTFTQAVTSGLNTGYVDIFSPEMLVTLNQSNNLIYPVNTQMALAIFTDGSSDAQTLNWGGATYAAILTDTTWLAPAFAVNTNPVNFNLGASTIAVFGTYSNNDGNQQIGLTSVPEPDTWALLAASLTTVMVFRRRRANG
jgi:hypothetical protein